MTLKDALEVEVFIYPDPSTTELDADGVAQFIEKVSETVGPTRVVEVSTATGRMFAKLDADSLRRAAGIPSARLAANTFHAAPDNTSATASPADAEKFD